MQVQQQLRHLQEELIKEKRERAQAQEELEKIEYWRTNSDRNMYGSKNKLQILEQELEKSKESEQKMLESLTSQTKQLEQTKICLEEAKLELKSLKDTVKFLESTSIGSQIKENESLRSTLMEREYELRIAKKECARLKIEAEESFLSWREKENGFLKCISLCEEEMVVVKEENEKMAETQRGARREVSKLRDILKQAINEAKVVKESLEIARKENSELKDSLQQKENVVQCIKHELESLKVSEAAALSSVKELKNMIDAISSMDSNKNTVKFEGESPRLPPKALLASETNNGRASKRNLAKSSLGPQSRNRNRRYSFGDSYRIGGCMFDISSPERMKEKDRVKSAEIEFGASDIHDQGPDTPTRLMVKTKKRDAIMKKFESMLRWRSFHK